MSDAQYRRELELELERLTKELADVRVEKAQQRQRIEQLQHEQIQLKDQLSHKTAGDKELRTDLADQLHTLHQVVRQKKQEHSKVRQEWERSQEQYNQLKQTVGLLQGSAVSTLIQKEEDDASLQESNGPREKANLKSHENEADDDGKQQSELRSLDDSTLDSAALSEDCTKESLSIFGKKNSPGDVDNATNRQSHKKKKGGEGGGLGKFFSAQDKKKEDKK
mmetsp:Transcript_3778/g.5934  ORF Transcript_3778/g.5934 Transcript_3778/m.5934 type:complete len:222 (-) Transcript_3778:108-773(-)|eukprot:CAMPEP_0178915908 /NCGR_PEP_ID=MMETSP0786-20121207/12310_1 /TAXON_ID=186022 /ORGANISM="Thalassionema frauenfeldii, Strain CCMP 1798" /LENGTH=221 /DNA_ID=CAMNT_0020589115 /DNA_START=268 /DNA_END=933 /DNA_ORIENTATION=-